MKSGMFPVADESAGLGDAVRQMKEHRTSAIVVSHRSQYSLVTAAQVVGAITSGKKHLRDAEAVEDLHLLKVQDLKNARINLHEPLSAKYDTEYRSLINLHGKKFAMLGTGLSAATVLSSSEAYFQLLDPGVRVCYCPKDNVMVAQGGKCPIDPNHKIVCVP